ncbi:MAG: sugar ABC transporter ATP-binding protein [Lachnospiraceae bacterium]|nr:sugar ABC transporter ATP-binding protein [Lachnospiraceae bacterium]
MEPLLKMTGISKAFSGVKVLENINLDLRAGEVHALLGENGAGKSTLIKILGGAYTKDAGEIFVEGNKVNISDVESAKENGIRVIHQELMLVPEMTVAENIFMGQEPKNKLGIVNKTKMNQMTTEFLENVGLNLKPTQVVGKLNIAQRQMIEITKAISFGAKIVVMDEPTSSLTDKEVDVLFEAIKELKKRNVGIIYISHRMSELDEITDRVTVLRDGQYISTVETKKTSHDELVSLMVGRALENLYMKHNHATEEKILEVSKLSAGKEVRNVSFDLKKGEVLGFSGLVGSGRSETMDCIFGLRKKNNGTIRIEGKEVAVHCVKDAMDAGIGLVPEDRKKEGIYPVQGIRFNASIEVLNKFLKNGLYNKRKELELVKKYVDDVMDTKYANLEQAIGKLSGGNQQKIIISRWLLATEKVLILDEPTRGIDIKTKSDIYHLIDKLTQDGLSIIFISSEMPELINMCDRIVVMNQGISTGILDKSEFSQETIMKLATMEV